MRKRPLSNYNLLLLLSMLETMRVQVMTTQPGGVVIGLMMLMSRLLLGMLVYTRGTCRLLKTQMNSKGSY